MKKCFKTISGFYEINLKYEIKNFIDLELIKNKIQFLFLEQRNDNNWENPSRIINKLINNFINFIHF